MGLCKRKEPEQIAMVAEHHGPATEQIGLRMTFQERNLARQPLGKAEVVRIHSRNVPPPRKIDTAIQPQRQTKVEPILQYPDPGIADRGRQAGRTISRSVVQHDDLEIAESLREHGLECAA
jgi:hypothetical protein